MSVDECPVCLHEIAMTQILPCAHSICSVCLRDILLKTSASTMSCPLCRGAIRGCDPPIVERLEDKVCCELERHSMEDPLGVVIASEGGRIVVRDVDSRGFGRAMGLAKSDELVSVNGLPCTNQGVVQDVLRASPRLRVWVSRVEIAAIPKWRSEVHDFVMSCCPLWWRRR